MKRILSILLLLAVVLTAWGNIPHNQSWKDGSNQVVRTQKLVWDAFGRLVKVYERDGQNNGYNWLAKFDGLGRRIQALTYQATNTLTLSSPASTIQSYYDPQVEFLEIGVSVNGVTTWKTYGPDVDGIYGGQQGLGGLETLSGNASVGAIQDQFGNVVAGVSNGVVLWNASRVSGYGPVEGYVCPALSGATLSLGHLSWRGKYRDGTGLYCWGVRPYDYERRSFLSFDPFGRNATPDGYAAFNGNPTAYFDADGRLSARSTALGTENAPPPYELGIAPIMMQSVYTDYYFMNGNHVGPLSPSQDFLYDPNSVKAKSYSRVTEPTGESFSYVRDMRDASLLADSSYGSRISTPITTLEVEQQQRLNFLTKQLPTALIYLDGANILLRGGFGLMAAEPTANPWVMGSYREMQAITVGQRGAIQAHHILEERHLLNWGLSASEAPAVVLSRAEHTTVTSLLRQELPYGQVYSREAVWNAYQRVYSGTPEWLDSISIYFKKP